MAEIDWTCSATTRLTPSRRKLKLDGETMWVSSILPFCRPASVGALGQHAHGVAFARREALSGETTIVFSGCVAQAFAIAVLRSWVYRKV